MSRGFYEKLPQEHELTVPELHLTWPELKAGSLYFGKFCDFECKEFMLCRREHMRDKVACLDEGKEVTKCAFKFFGKVKKHCFTEFTRYYKCLDYEKKGELDFNKCRRPQYDFDECALKNIGVVRPYVGFFSKTRLHEGKRPREPYVKHIPDDIKEPPNVEELMKTPVKNKHFPTEEFRIFD